MAVSRGACISPHAEQRKSVTPPELATTSVLAVRSLRPQHEASFVVQTTLLMSSATHVQRLPESIPDCDDRRDESWPTPRNARWHRWNDQGMGDRVCARHFLTSMGSETTLGCLAADRAAVECPEYLSSRCRSMMKVGKMHIPPTALGPASGLSAVLGRDALGQPGDCDRARRR